MKMRVLFFSVLRDLVEKDELNVVLPEGKPRTVAGLLEHLYGKYPRLRDWDQSLLIAADLDYVKRDSPLEEGQEIAIMPPVQGG